MVVAGTATIILTPTLETFPACTPRHIVARTGGESKKDTRPQLVRNERPATTPRQTGRTLKAEVNTLRDGRTNDQDKEVILDQL